MAASVVRGGDRLVLPAGIMGELAYMVESRVSGAAFDAVLRDIERGLYMLDCGEGDIPRIRKLIRRYAGFPLGYADASVIACAERLHAPVFTFDRRHFIVVASEGSFTVVP